MRTITILAFTLAVTIATVLAFSLMREDAVPEQPQAITSSTVATSDLNIQDKLDELASVLRRYQQTNQNQLQQTELELARLNKRLADFDTRLRSLETTGVEQFTEAAESNSFEQFTESAETNSVEQASDLAVSDSGARNPESRKVSEADLRQWMDETLLVEKWDREATELAIEQAERSLAKVPGVNLEDMQCGDGFCRATFNHENGKQPNIRGLFGEPPFVNAGFTTHEADGSVSLYFIEPGMSLRDFQSEAQESGQFGGGDISDL